MSGRESTWRGLYAIVRPCGRRRLALVLALVLAQAVMQTLAVFSLIPFLGAAADIVIEASRPRALHHLGIHSEQLLGAGGPWIWVSITGFGGDGDRDSLRVGFGDDCAAAGGLVDWSGDGPRFLGDAVADPVTGLVSASAVLDQVFERESLAAPSGCHIRVALAECANWVFCGGRLGDDRRD